MGWAFLRMLREGASVPVMSSKYSSSSLSSWLDETAAFGDEIRRRTCESMPAHKISKVQRVTERRWHRQVGLWPTKLKRRRFMAYKHARLSLQQRLDGGLRVLEPHYSLQHLARCQASQRADSCSAGRRRRRRSIAIRGSGARDQRAIRPAGWAVRCPRAAVRRRCDRLEVGLFDRVP